MITADNSTSLEFFEHFGFVKYVYKPIIIYSIKNIQLMNFIITSQLYVVVFAAVDDSFSV